MQTHASRADDDDALAGLNVGRVQDRAGTREAAATEKSRLGEGHVFRYLRQLIRVNKGLLGERTQSEALRHVCPDAFEPRRLICGAQGCFRVQALVASPGYAVGA